MAKNIFQKKKRIAHFQSIPQYENENALSGCLDYVSNIIETMDSSFKSLHSNCPKIQAKTKVINDDKQNDNSSNKPTSSFHKTYSKNFGKKSLFSRKFPLMEKSQKILKQIKHNRNISKPRAHLAALPKSPEKRDTAKLSTIKKKEELKHVKKMKSNPDLCRNTDISIKKTNDVTNTNFNSNGCKISKKSSTHKRENANFTDWSQYYVNEHEYNANRKCNTNTNIRKNNLDDTKVLNNSGNETTDSEYERFVNKNKKGLRKKIVKRQKQSTTKKIASNKESKNRVLRSKRTSKQCNSAESDSDDNDVLSLSKSMKVNSYKKYKVAQLQTVIDTDSVNEKSKSHIVDASAQGLSFKSNKKIASKKESKVLSKRTLKQSDSVESDSDNNDVPLDSVESDSDNNDVPLDYVESDSDNTDVPLSCISMKINSYKKCKVTQLQTDTDTDNVNEKSEFDVSTQDPSFKSKDDCSTSNQSFKSDAINKTLVANRIKMKDVKDTSSTLQKAHFAHDSDCEYVANLSDVSVSRSIKTVPEISHTSIGNVPPKIFVPEDLASHVSSPFGSGKIESKCLTSNLVIDLCDSDDDNETVACSEHSNLEVKNNNMTADCTGLFNSDSCNNIVPKKEKLYIPNQEKNLIKGAQNVSNQDSDESDIEIIEIVPTRPKVDSITNAAATVVISSSGKEKCQTLEDDNVSKNSIGNSQLVVKTETGVDSSYTRTKDKKYEAVYMTNICTDLDHDEQVNLNQTLISSKELLETSLTGALVDGTVPKTNLKRESESDDDIIILDLDQTEISPGNVSDFNSYKRVKTEAPNNSIKSSKNVNYSAQNRWDIPLVIDGEDVKSKHLYESLSSLENIDPKESVLSKIKNTPMKDKLKLHKDMCSSSTFPLNLSGFKSFEENLEYENLRQMSDFHLVELYKKEFQNYQEIVQTEATVGASLKLLEFRQAEKVKFIRSLVQKYITADKVSKDSFVNKEFLDDLSSSSSNSKTVVLASSKLDSDIKPNISKFDSLQNVQLLQQPTVTIKKDPEPLGKFLNSSKVESSEKQTLELLNEKCNVCGRKAMAACQGCAKVFFCSHECGRKFWNDGHISECGK